MSFFILSSCLKIFGHKFRFIYIDIQGYGVFFVESATTRSGSSSSLRERHPSSLRERHPPSLRERDGTTISLRSLLPYGLRPLAVILDCVWFASLTRGQSNPLRGFGVSLVETKTRLCSLVFVSRRERDGTKSSRCSAFAF